MTKKDIINELTAMNIKFDKRAKRDVLEQLLNDSKAEQRAEQNRDIEQRAKKEETAKKATVKYSRDERLANIASLIANDAYDNNLTIKLMSNKSVAVKKDRMRLFRLDLLNKEYQLTSDRDTLLHCDERVESVYKESKRKFFYRFRTSDKQDVIRVMRRCIELYK